MQFFQGHFDCVMLYPHGIRINVSRALADGRGVVVEIPTVQRHLDKMEIIMRYIYRFAEDIAALQDKRKTDL
jgi:hypothetical protein